MYGHHIRNLLILAATEFEAQCVGILHANNVHSIGNHFNTNDYVKLLEAMRLNEYRFKLAMFPDYPLVMPFAHWHKASPTKSLEWYHSYNKTKHNREVEFSGASLQNAINAVVACTTMYIAQVLGTDCNS